MKTFALTLLLAAAAYLSADTLSTTVNQQANGGAWYSLGTFRFLAGRAGYVRIRTTGANGYVIADAVRIVKDSVATILDTEDGIGVQVIGAWTQSSTTSGFHGSSYLHDGNLDQGTKSIRFAPLVPETGEYQVFLIWTAGSNRASNVPVDIIHNLAPPQYTLTVANGSGSGSYEYGALVAVVAAAPLPGQVFDRWTSSGGGNFLIPTAPATQFTMPEADVTITARYKPAPLAIRSSARTVPQVAAVDIVVVGGNIGGVAAALAAAAQGAKVLVTSPTSSFCAEMSAKSRFWLGPGEMPRAGLEQDLFDARADTAGYAFITPGTYKRAIEDKLTAAGIEFQYYTNAVDVLQDGSGNLAGVVLANKSGRQAVAAKIVIDATPMAGLAQIAGAAMTPWGTDSVTVSRVLMFANADSQGSLVTRFNDTCEVREYTLRVPMSSGSWAERSRAETMLRHTWPKPHATWTGHVMHMIEPNHVVCRATDSSALWTNADSLDLDVCRPTAVDRMYIINSMCALSRVNAARLVRPLNLIRLGQRIGARAAIDAGALPAPAATSVRTAVGASALTGLDVAEDLSGHHPFKTWPRIPQNVVDVSNWGDYDVIVVGGGTAGAPAAISAARAGARVLLVEALGALGGTGVNGIGKFWAGYRKGFAVELNKGAWKATEKSQWLFNELVKAGGEVWFNTLACGSIMEGHTVRGVVVATPSGRGVVTGRVVIDATGDGDICAWSGAEVLYVNDGDVAIQDGSHLGDDAVPSNYTNEFASIYADPANTQSMTQFHRLYRKYGTHRNKFDFYPLAGIRETRLIKGDYVVTSLDQYLNRTYHDLLVVASSDFDMHGYQNSPCSYTGLFPDGTNYIPYRALLPRNLSNILVTGRCKSVTHDALPLSRMQSDLANEGYAAGYIAAQCAAQGIDLRAIDLGPVQGHLVSVGNITAAHRTNQCVDMPAPTDSALMAAAELTDSLNHAALLMLEPQRSLPLLRASFAAAPTKLKAKTLCMLGDTTGVSWLAGYLDTTALGTGLAYSSTLRAITDVDGIIWALGLTGDARAVPALTAKLDTCGLASTDFSHLRALLTALGRIRSPQAKPALRRFLARSGVTGYHKQAGDANSYTTTTELKSFIELFGAAALYRSDDTLDQGRTILENYLNDWRGILVRYAGTVLGIDSTVNAVTFDPRERFNSRSLVVFPNPGSHRITLDIPARLSGSVRQVTIAGLDGQVVRRLPAAARICVWDCTNDHGAPVVPGIYLLTVTTAQESLVRRIVLSK